MDYTLVIARENAGRRQQHEAVSDTPMSLRYFSEAPGAQYVAACLLRWDKSFKLSAVT